MKIDKIIAQLEGKEALLVFLRDNFPDILEKWKGSRNRATTTTEDDTGTNSKDQLRNGYRDRINS